MNDPETIIEVKASLTSPAAWQTLRVVILFIAGALFSHYFNESVAASGVAALAAVLTFAVGIWKLVKDRDTKVALANKLPDSVAVVK